MSTMRWVEAPPMGTAGRLRSLAAFLGVAALCGLMLATGLRDPLLLFDFAKPFEVVHGLLAGVVAAAALAIAGIVVAAPLALVQTWLGAMQTFMLGAVAVAPLPFAAASDPGAGGASAAGAGAEAAAASEMQAGAYTGWNGTRPSRVRYRQPKGTDLTIEDMKWLGESFTEEPYWGVRGTFWPARLRSVGVMFDYTHAKATALKSQQLSLSGTRDGEKVGPKEPFSASFRKLEFTHGLNFTTLNAVYRLSGLHPRVAPYVGIGIGISWPHVDTQRTGWEKETRTYRHQITGPTFQVLGGLQWRLSGSGSVSAFTEYKLNYSANTAKLKGGGSIETDLWTHQVPVGLSYHLRRTPK